MSKHDGKETGLEGDSGPLCQPDSTMVDRSGPETGLKQGQEQGLEESPGGTQDVVGVELSTTRECIDPSTASMDEPPPLHGMTLLRDGLTRHSSLGQRLTRYNIRTTPSCSRAIREATALAESLGRIQLSRCPDRRGAERSSRSMVRQADVIAWALDVALMTMRRDARKAGLDPAALIRERLDPKAKPVFRGVRESDVDALKRINRRD